jgi:adenine-specific DNA-methyltransferase
MPTLDFKGKPFVYSHHLSVPFRELVVDAKKSLTGEDEPSLDDNLIIHGDNLEALKALLPRYAGKVDVIYIDPPYNTGNEGWAYNDNVNSPLMKEWLGKVVDQDDLERHDKWLCMMWPRLQLLRDLLSDEGFIFVSISDHEVANLTTTMNEIFGEAAFIACVVVESNKRGQTYGELAKTHEYLLIYTKLNGSLSEVEGDADSLPFSDERGGYDLWELRNRNPKFNRGNRPNLFYPIYLSAKPHADGQHRVSMTQSAAFPIEVLPRNSAEEDGCWRWGKEKVKSSILDGDAPDLVGKLNRNDRYVVLQRSRRTLTKVKTIWTGSELLNEQGTTLLGKLGMAGAFPFPKPVALIEKALSISTSGNGLILDSFAGSGTTGHAVLSANNKDGGSRRFILIEVEDYAKTVTAERLRRVATGVKSSSAEELKQGCGGSFTFCSLGDPIDLERFFAGEGAPDWEQVARYVAYTATGQTLSKAPKKPSKDWFVGEVGGCRIHLVYKADLKFMRSNEAALDMATAERIHKSAEGKPGLVYAAAKFMGQKALSDLGITFCQLPYSIHRILGDGPNEA